MRAYEIESQKTKEFLIVTVIDQGEGGQESSRLCSVAPLKLRGTSLGHAWHFLINRKAHSTRTSSLLMECNPPFYTKNEMM